MIRLIFYLAGFAFLIVLMPSCTKEYPKANCANKKDVECKGKDLSEPRQSYGYTGFARGGVQIVPNHPNLLLYIKKEDDEVIRDKSWKDYRPRELILYNKDTHEEKLIFSRNFDFQYLINSAGIIAINDFYAFDTLDRFYFIDKSGQKIGQWENYKKFTFYSLEDWSPNAKFLLAQYLDTTSNKKTIGIFSYETQDLMLNLNYDYNVVQWDTPNEIYASKYGVDINLLNLDNGLTTYSELNIIEDINTIIELRSSYIYDLDIKNNKLLINDYEGINTLDLTTFKVARIRCNKCDKVVNVSSLYDPANEKIIFHKYVSQLKANGNYDFQELELFEMDTNGCNELEFEFQ